MTIALCIILSLLAGAALGIAGFLVWLSWYAGRDSDLG